MKVDYLHTCDFASVDAAGKLNIVGSFDEIKTKIPSSPITLYIAMGLSLEDSERNGDLVATLLLKDPSGSEGFGAEMKLPKLEQGSRIGRTVKFVFALNGFELRVPGMFAFEVMYEGRTIFSKSFEVAEP